MTKPPFPLQLSLSGGSFQTSDIRVPITTKWHGRPYSKVVKDRPFQAKSPGWNLVSHIDWLHYLRRYSTCTAR